MFDRRPDSFEGTFQIDETGTWTNDPVQASGRVDSEPSRRFEYTQPFVIRWASVNSFKPLAHLALCFPRCRAPYLTDC